MTVTNADLAKWAGYSPDAPKGFATEHVFTGEEWVTRTVPAEPAPKTCHRCGSMLTDGKHCPVNPRHNRKPRVTRRPDTPLAGFGTDTAAIVRKSIAPRSVPAHSPVVAAGRTVVTGNGAEFAPVPLSGKVQHFTPLPGPVYGPVPQTSAQSAANREATKRAGSVVTRDRKSANVTRFPGRRVNGNASCTTCGSIRTSNGECASAAWHMTALDT